MHYRVSIEVNEGNPSEFTSPNPLPCSRYSVTLLKRSPRRSSLPPSPPPPLPLKKVPAAANGGTHPFFFDSKRNINSPLSQASISLLSSVTFQNLAVCPAGGVCWVGVGKLTYCSFYSQQCSCAQKTHESDIRPPSPNVHTIKSTTLKTTQVKITDLNHAAHRVLNRLLL